MKYKIAICDDSDADRQYILNIVNRWADAVGHIVHMETFSSAENFMFHYSQKNDYDILLLDIEIIFTQTCEVNFFTFYHVRVLK